MELLNKAMSGKTERPVRVIQFGEGNFLRGFVDYMIDIANEKGYFDGDIVVVKPRASGSLAKLKEQECQYTVSLKGLVEGAPAVSNRIVTSVADAVHAYAEYEKYSALAKLESLRFVVSNTTEAGIVFDPDDRMEMCPPNSFPGKLTKFLYERYLFFKGARDKGLIMLPTELIDDNGIALKNCVKRMAALWKLETGFIDWLEEACVFTSTLVDRIVTGYPAGAEALWQEWGYQDSCIVTGEPFALWVIESDRDISAEFPLNKAGLPVIYTEDQKPYEKRKVRILNGAHTSFVLASFLCGNDYVLESMEDEKIGAFVRSTIYEEVIPTISMPKEELEAFAEDVFERFKNPFVKHALLSISLNSVFKWKTRCMPTLLDYAEEKGELPKHLTFSLAALMAFYSFTERGENSLTGYRNGEPYLIRDEAAVLDFFAENAKKDSYEFVELFLKMEQFWGQDLTKVEGLAEWTAEYLEDIRTLGMRGALEKWF